jgi:hypothetical protein
VASGRAPLAKAPNRSLNATVEKCAHINWVGKGSLKAACGRSFSCRKLEAYPIKSCTVFIQTSCDLRGVQRTRLPAPVSGTRNSEELGLLSLDSGGHSRLPVVQIAPHSMVKGQMPIAVRAMVDRPKQEEEFQNLPTDNSASSWWLSPILPPWQRHGLTPPPQEQYLHSRKGK